MADITNKFFYTYQNENEIYEIVGVINFNDKQYMQLKRNNTVVLVKLDDFYKKFKRRVLDEIDNDVRR